MVQIKALKSHSNTGYLLLAIEFIYAILYSLSIQWDAWRKKVKLFKKSHRADKFGIFFDENSPVTVAVSPGLLGVRCSVQNPAQFQDGSSWESLLTLGPEHHPSAHTKGLFGSCSPMHHGARPRGLKNWFVLVNSRRLVLCKMFDLHLSPTKCQRRLP